MSSYSGSLSQHQTLTANTVDTVTLDNDYDTVEILNRGTSDIYYRTDGTDPTVSGAGCNVVPAGQHQLSHPQTAGNTVVKLISSAGSTAYSVTGS